MKNNLLKHKLAAYSTLGTAMLALSGQESDAQIIYHDVNPDISLSHSDSADIDLNNDGIVDFHFTYGVTRFSTSSFFQRLFTKIKALNGNLFEDFNSVSDLPLSTSISKHHYFRAGNAKIYSQICTETAGAKIYTCYHKGQWYNLFDGYIGIKLILGDGAHYGWIRMDGRGKIIKDFAYQSQPNVPILAGQFDECDTVKAAIIGCVNSTLEANAASAYQYQWLKENIPINGATNSSYFPSSPGNYRVVLFSAGCADTSLIHTVQYPPAVTRSGNTFYSNYPSGNQWYKNYTIIPGATKNYYTIRVSGLYGVTETDTLGCVTPETVFNAELCKDMLSNTIFIEGTKDSACPGQSIQLKSLNLSNYTYQWLRNDSSINGATSSIYTTFASGNYRMILYNTTGCYDTSNAIQITIANPTPVISRTGFVLTSSYPTGNQWLLNENEIAGATNQQYTAVAGGNYSVRVTDKNGCIGVSDSVQVSFTGLSNVGEDTSIIVFIQNKMILTLLPQKWIGSELMLFDELGILRNKILMAEKENIFTTQDLETGVYFLRIRKGNELIVRKVTVS